MPYGRFDDRLLPCGNLFRPIQNLDIRCYTLGLHSPFAVLVEECETRHCHAATIDKSRVATYANEATPGALSDEQPETQLPEVVRERISAR